MRLLQRCDCYIKLPPGGTILEVILCNNHNVVATSFLQRHFHNVASTLFHNV